MSNFPAGAYDDPKAPYNENTKKIQFTYSISNSEDIEVNNKLTDNEINESICEYLKNKYGRVSIDFLEIDN